MSAQPTKLDVNHMESNLLSAADVLGIDLHLVEGKVRGNEEKVVQLSGWKLPFDVVACSDQVTPLECSFFVKFRGALWGFLCVYKESHLLYFFDGMVAGITVANMSSFGEKMNHLTRRKLGKAVTRVFRYDVATTVWSAVDEKDVADLVGV